MDEENEKRSLFDISQYSENTRRAIFGVLAVLLVSIVAIAMFVISPQNEKTLTQSEDSSSTEATAAPVDDESTATPTAPPTEGATGPVENYNGNFPKDETEEQALAQKEIIEKGLEEQKALVGKEISDVHEVIPNAAQLQALASKGMLEYCTDVPNETKEQKQDRMKPYFHQDNSDYQSPQSLFFLRNCSVEGTTEVMHDETETKTLVYIGVAWASQYEKDGDATTGYTQYRVEVDKDGIVSFDD